MGEFIGDTIQSVLSQDYPSIEYTVMDGGSTDATPDILASYADRLAYTSRPDNGAAHAIRTGFARSSGDILAFLNADDVYFPGAVTAAVQAFEQNPDAAVVYGDALWIDASGNPIANYPTRDFDAASLVRECYICQPAAFFLRAAYEAVGGMDPSLHFTYDYDLWLRLARRSSFVHQARMLAKSRMHRGNKTLGGRRGMFRETISTVHAAAGYAPFGPIYSYACHLVDGRDQFFDPLRPSVFKFALALAIGVRFNGLGCGRFWRESMAAAGLIRR